MDVEVKYCSTVRGCDDNLNEDPKHFYCGFVQRIPASGQEHGEAMIQSIKSVQEFLGPTKLADGSVVEPVPDVALERYEVFDFASDEIVVMWRIPVRPVPQNGHR